MYGRHRKRTPWRPSMTSIRNTAAVSAPGLRPRGSLEKAARSQLVELRTDRVRSAAPPAGSRESVGHPPPPGLVADRAMTYVNVPSTPHAEEFGFEAFGTDRIGLDVLRIDVAKTGGFERHRDCFAIIGSSPPYEHGRKQKNGSDHTREAG